MAIILLFVVVVVLSFSAVLYITRPSSQEKQLQQRLDDISVSAARAPEDEPALLKTVTYSDIPLLDTLLKRFSVTRNLKTLIAQADSQWTVGRLVATTALIFASVTWLGSFWIPSLPIRFVLAALLSSAPYVSIRVQRTRRFRKFETTLLEALDLMTRALRAGHSVSSAVEMVGREVAAPVGPEFRKCFEQQNFGLPFRESMEDLARRVPVADLQFLVTAILVQKESGGNLAEVLDKAGHVIRERLRIKGELAIYTAQGKLTGWILGLLPFILFLLISLVNPNYTSVLMNDPLGQKAVLLGLAMMGIGFFVIRRIIDIKV